eukprot:2031085-Prymnesium_polylepis.2
MLDLLSPSRRAEASERSSRGSQPDLALSQGTIGRSPVQLDPRPPSQYRRTSGRPSGSRRCRTSSLVAADCYCRTRRLASRAASPNGPRAPARCVPAATARPIARHTPPTPTRATSDSSASRPPTVSQGARECSARLCAQLEQK